jgi:hypothetical protein
MLDDAWYQARGYPVASGSAESANKLIVECRLKGVGMDWARPNVNPMVARRTITCDERWQEAWLYIAQHVWHHHWQSRLHRQTVKRPSQAPIRLPTLPPQQPVTLPSVQAP